MTRAALTLAGLLLLACVVEGCGDHRGPGPFAYPDNRPAGRHYLSPRGVRVWCPLWLRQPLRGEALAEVDTTAPEADARLVSPPRGVPLHVECVVYNPGAFDTEASPTGLARGQTDMASYVRVAFRMQPWETVPLLPALAHELRHVVTRDAAAGHR